MSLSSVIQEGRILRAKFILESTMSDLKTNPKVKDPEALGGWLYWHRTKNPKGGVQTKAGREKLSKKAKERAAKEKEKKEKKDPYAKTKSFLKKHGGNPATQENIDAFLKRLEDRDISQFRVHEPARGIPKGWESGDPVNRSVANYKRYDSNEEMVKALRGIMSPEIIGDIGDQGFTISGANSLQSVAFHSKEEDTKRDFRGRGKTMTAKDMDAFKADLLEKGARRMQRREADQEPFSWRQGEPMGSVRNTTTYKKPEELQKAIDNFKIDHVVDHGEGVLTFINSKGNFDSFTFDVPPKRAKKPKNALKTRSATEQALKQAGLTQVAGGTKYTYYAAPGTGKKGKMLRVAKKSIRPVERLVDTERGRKKIEDRPLDGESYFGSLDPEALAELMKFIS